ncbi:MAG: hypothetical protein IT258_22400 [Saprospiraceae bacterium]|nr:hypothetical protein [Saprospiraceae bacterium]
MRLLPKLLLLIGLASNFIACTPRTIVRMDADETAEVKWSYGRQIIQLGKDSLDAQVYFDTYNKNDLVFDVELTNWGKQSILVAPENIYIRCGEDGPTRLAADPEWVLLKQEIDASRHEANAKNIAIAVGAVAAVGVVAAVVSDNNNNGGNNNDNNSNNFNSNNNVFISTYVAPPLPAPVMPPSVDFWANYSLRKTTLDEKYKVGGKVVVPRLDGCPNLELYLPFGNGEPLVAKFRQRIIQP